MIKSPWKNVGGGGGGGVSNLQLPDHHSDMHPTERLMPALFYWKKKASYQELWNSKDPDWMLQNAASDQGLHCLPHNPAVFTHQMVTKKTCSKLSTSSERSSGVPILMVNMVWLVFHRYFTCHRQEAHRPQFAHLSETTITDNIQHFSSIATVTYQHSGLVALVFHIKIWGNWAFDSGKEAQNRYPRWQPSWISDRNDFSYFWSTNHPDAS